MKIRLDILLDNFKNQLGNYYFFIKNTFPCSLGNINFKSRILVLENIKERFVYHLFSNFLALYLISTSPYGFL